MRRIAPAHVLAWAEQRCIEGVSDVTAYGWIPAETVAVLGLSQQAQRELRLDALNAAGIPILRRASGGGAVLLSPGVLCFGAFAPPAAISREPDIREAFRLLTAPVVDLCADIGVNACMAGISDIAAHLDNRLVKIAGCAQLRKRGAVLVHGSLLVAAEIECFEHYLNFPGETPAYRDNRRHGAFCRNLAELTARPVSVDELGEAFKQACLRRGWHWTDVPASLEEKAQKLLAEKYRCADWNFRRKRPPRAANR